MQLTSSLIFQLNRRRAQWAIGLSIVAHVYFLVVVESEFEPPKIIPTMTTYQVDLVSEDIGYEKAPVDDVLPPAEPEQKQVTEELGTPPPPPKTEPKPEPVKKEQVAEEPKKLAEPVSAIAETKAPVEEHSEEVATETTAPDASEPEPVEAEPQEPVEKTVETQMEEVPKESVPEIKPSLPVYEVGSKNNPKPPYPTLATRKGWQGTVVLGVSVNSDGSIKNVIIIESSDYAVFNFAAWETVKQEWVFEPAMLEGQPVDSYIEVPIVFELE